MKIKNYFLLIFVLVTSFKCSKVGESRNTLFVKNNSTDTITFYVEVGKHLYPDTTIEETKIVMPKVSFGNSFPWSTGLKWEKFFDQLPRDTLSIYVFNLDTLKKYDWSVIRNNYKVLRRYDLSLPDLERMKFKIEYP